MEFGNCAALSFPGGAAGVSTVGSSPKRKVASSGSVLVGLLASILVTVGSFVEF